MSEVQKDLEDLSAGIGQFLKNQYLRILFSILCQSWQG
jgi:hypothetical protein